MREPHDVFIKEFFQHPAWDQVLGLLENVAFGLKEQVMSGTREDFDLRKGRVEGVYETLSYLRGLINSYNAKG